MHPFGARTNKILCVTNCSHFRFYGDVGADSSAYLAHTAPHFLTAIHFLVLQRTPCTVRHTPASLRMANSLCHAHTLGATFCPDCHCQPLPLDCERTPPDPHETNQLKPTKHKNGLVRRPGHIYHPISRGVHLSEQGRDPLVVCRLGPSLLSTHELIIGLSHLHGALHKDLSWCGGWVGAPLGLCSPLGK